MEIGFSWVGHPWQRSPVNSEAKYLLLGYAFEQARCQRVEFKADAENAPSCQALLRIGATRACASICPRRTRARGISRSSASSIASGPTSKRGWSCAYIDEIRIQLDARHEVAHHTHPRWLA